MVWTMLAVVLASLGIVLWLALTTNGQPDVMRNAGSALPIGFIIIGAVVGLLCVGFFVRRGTHKRS
jgi:hypothetical protein